MTNALGAHGRRGRVSGLARAAALAVIATLTVVGAVRSDARVQLAAPSAGAGLPERSDVLIDEVALVCPGQQRAGALGLRDVVGSVRVAAAAPPASALVGLTAPKGPGLVSLADPSGRALASVSERLRATTGTPSGAQPMVARGNGSLAAGLAATQSWFHTGDDDRGLALTPCTLPTADAWLVAGGGGPSRTERLILTNPGANAVTVTIDVLGAKGPVSTTDRAPVTIAPRARMVVSLDALAPDEQSPAVHVVARGGVVAAVLDDAFIDGATARGIDDATPAASPAGDLVVAGIDPPQPGAGATFVRLVNPEADEAVARLSVLTSDGAVQPDALRAVRVPARSTLDVPLSIAARPSGLRITSDTPLTAAAYVERRVTAGADREGDFGWAPAMPALRVTGGVVIPDLGKPTTRTLLLAAGDQGGAVTVTTGTGTAARDQLVRVSPNTARSVDLGAAGLVFVSTSAPDVRAAVTVLLVDRGVPYYGIVPIASAPTTAVSLPVRQVAG